MFFHYTSLLIKVRNTVSEQDGGLQFASLMRHLQRYA